MNDSAYLIIISLLTFVSVYLLICFGWHGAVAWLGQQERWFVRVLGHQLLIDIHPRTALGLAEADRPGRAARTLPGGGAARDADHRGHRDRP